MAFLTTALQNILIKPTVVRPPTINLSPVTTIARPPTINLSPVLTIPLPPFNPPVVVRPPIIIHVPTIQNLGQQYQFQDYNSDGVSITKQITATQLLGGGTNATFTPENANNLSATTSAAAKLVASLNLSTIATAKLWQDSCKIDYTLCLKSQQSLPVEFNMLQTPSLSTQVNYEFYTSDETDIATQEDQALDPLLTNDEVPRYVMLRWNVTNTVNQSPDFASRTPQECSMVNGYLSKVRGCATMANAPMQNSVQKNTAQVQPIFRGGQALKLVDTHDLERGFNSTSNARLFKNTATVTVNTNAINENTLSFNDLILDDLT